MNNLTWMGRKVARDLLERRAVGSVRAVLPHVEQFIAVNRYPLLPKIVLYSAAASSESLLRQYSSPQSGRSPTSPSSPPRPPQKPTTPSPAVSLKRSPRSTRKTRPPSAATA